VGECGGKNYHLIHESADLENVAYCSVRGAFEYSGQKCSATARMYVPESCWPEVGVWLGGSGWGFEVWVWLIKFGFDLDTHG